MSDFEYDCHQKKQIARSARSRKNGSKSKKCSLPSDRLTQKQWKERCGPVLSYNLNKPMSWDDFKRLPADIQAEYITNLQNKYGVTAVNLAEMFDVQPLTVRRHVETNGIPATFPRGQSMGAVRRAEWERFLNPEQVEEPQEETNEPWVFENDEPAEENHETSTGMAMKKFCLSFCGDIDVNMIANSLRLILGNQSKGEVEIICNLA